MNQDETKLTPEEELRQIENECGIQWREFTKDMPEETMAALSDLIRANQYYTYLKCRNKLAEVEKDFIS